MMKQKRQPKQTDRRKKMNKLILAVSIFLLYGCDSMFVEPAYFPASDYSATAGEFNEGEIDKLHYETILDWSGLAGTCLPVSKDLKLGFLELGYTEPEYKLTVLRLKPFGTPRDHSVLLVEGLGEPMIYDNGYISIEPFPLAELEKHGTYAPIEDYWLTTDTWRMNDGHEPNEIRKGIPR